MRALKIILRTLSHILSVILCLLLLVSTLATMFVADIRVATNKDNLQNVLNEILSAPPRITLGPISASTTVSPELDLGALLSGEGNLTEMLVEYAFEMLEGEGAEIDKEAIEAFVEESTINEFISDKASSIISDMVTGENTLTITGDEIKELLNENKDLIEQHFDVVITEEQIDSVAQKVEELPIVQEIQKNGVAGLLSGGMTAPDSEDDSTVSANPMTEINKMMNYVRMISADAVFFALVGVCAFLVALLFLFAWNKPYIAMFYSGSTFFSTGLSFLIPTLIAWLAPATWMGLFSNIPDVGSMIGSVSRIVLMLTGSVCGVVTGLGLVLFVGGIFVRAALKKKKAAKAALTENAPVSPVAAAAAEVYETSEVAAPAEEAAPVETAEAAEPAEADEVAAPEDAEAPAEAAEVPNT